MNPWVRRLGEKWNVPKMIDEMTRNVDDYNKLGRLMRQPVSGSGKDVHTTFVDLITLNSMSSKIEGHQVLDNMTRMISSLQKAGSLTEQQALQLFRLQLQ